jgi:uncharacterized RDD family membrane protein YckC
MTTPPPGPPSPSGWPPPGPPQPGQPGQQPQSYGYPAAPMPPPGGYVPGGLVLPPGVELASTGRRIGAWFLAIPLFIITLGIGYIVWGLILWSRGTTPALKVLGMKVWRLDTNQVPTWGRMALRDFLGRIVDGILGGITQLISFIMFLATDKRQSLHDKVASTTVVYDPQKVLGA